MKKSTILHFILLGVIILVMLIPSVKAEPKREDFLSVQKFKTPYQIGKDTYYTESYDKECLGLPLGDSFPVGMEDSRKYCCVEVTVKNPSKNAIPLYQKLTKGHGIFECHEECHLEYINETNITKKTCKEVCKNKYAEPKESYWYMEIAEPYTVKVVVGYENITEEFCEEESQSLWQKILNIFPWWRKDAEVICWNETWQEPVYANETRYRQKWEKIGELPSLRASETQKLLLCDVKHEPEDTVEWHIEMDLKDYGLGKAGFYPFWNGSQASDSFATLTPYNEYFADDFEYYDYLLPIHYYDLDGANNLTDKIGTIDGTYYGNATHNNTGGIFGGAIQNNGKTGAFNITGVNWDTNAGTIAYWIELDSETGYNAFVFYEDGTHEIKVYWTGTAHRFQWDLNGASNIDVASGTFDDWTHVIYTFDNSSLPDSTKEIKLYINGIEVGSADDVLTNLNIVKALMGDRINGTMDDVKIFNRGVNASEALWMYQNHSAAYGHTDFDWEENSGKWEIINTTDELGNPTLAYEQSIGIDNRFYSITNKTFTNFTAIAKVKPTVNERLVGITFGVTDADLDHEDLYYFGLMQRAGNDIYLAQEIDGINTGLNFTDLDAFSLNTWYWMMVNITGTKFEGYTSTDGHTFTLRLTYTFASEVTGKIGLFSQEAGVYDNLITQGHFRNATSTTDTHGWVYTNESITASYMYSDSEGDAFKNETIRFYNGSSFVFNITNTEFNSTNRSLASSYTSKGQTWSANITVCDAADSCSEEETQSVNIYDDLEPYIKIESPIDNTVYIYNDTGIWVNITASDNFLNTVWFYNGTGNQTYLGIEVENITKSVTDAVDVGAEAGILFIPYSDSSLSKVKFKYSAAPVTPKIILKLDGDGSTIATNRSPKSLGSNEYEATFPLNDTSLEANVQYRIVASQAGVIKSLKVSATFPIASSNDFFNVTSGIVGVVNYSTSWYMITSLSLNRALDFPTDIIFSLGDHTITAWAEDDWGNINSTSVDINVLPNFSICVAPNVIQSLNITFMDEENDSLVYADIDLDMVYWLCDTSGNVTFAHTDTNSTHFTYCIYPNWSSINVSYNILYDASGYPQRRYSPHVESGFTVLTNSTTQITVYLLETAEGIYARFVTIDGSITPIDGVDVLMQRELVSGTWTTIEREVTDSSGMATFWVNPDETYRFTFSKTGYDTQVKTLRPTSSEIYYIDMGGVAVGYPEVNASRWTGITWTITPLTRILNNDTTYNFTFTLNSTNQTVQRFSFQLYYSNGSTVITKNATTNGGVLSYSYDIGNQTNVTGKFRWYISGELTEHIIVWEITTIYKGAYSIMVFFDDFHAWAVGGITNKTRTMIAFIILFVIVASISGISGVYSYEGLLVFTMIAVGIIKLLGFIDNPTFVIIEILGLGLLALSLKRGV